MFIIIMILAYLIGAIPFGVIFARMKGVNLLTSGSRNSGATNAFRTAGPIVGALTAICDILKGFVVVWLASYIVEPNWQVYLAGVAAIFAHTKSIYIGFKGGKAIATSFGVFLYINTIPILITLLFWVAALLLTRMVSFASVVAGAVFPIATIFYTHEPIIVLISLAVAIWAIWRHKENIKRILSGTESKISSRKRELK